MQVANTRESLILALKNDKNSERWEEFVNQYYDFLYFAACKVDKETGRCAFVPDGVDPDEVVEQTFWQLKNIILPDRPQYDVDYTEDELAKKVRHGLKWKIFELDKGKRFRNYLLSVLKNVARSMYNARKADRLVFVDNLKLERGRDEVDDFEDEDSQPLWEAEIEAFERGEIRATEDDESENDINVKWLAAQYAIEAVMSDPRIERQTKEIYELLLEHAQNGRHGDGAFEAIAARFKVSPAAVYKHRQRMDKRLDDDGKKHFFERLFKAKLTDDEFADLKTLRNLAPGDFRTVRQKTFYLNAAQTNTDRIAALREECLLKRDGGQRRAIGFAA